MMNAASKWKIASDAEMVRRLEKPAGKIDVVLDTDTYNEIDDQFALSYMVRSEEKLEVKAIYAAPFSNHHSEGPADGMERSYQEIQKVLTLLEAEELKKVTYRGSTDYLPNEDEPIISDAAKDLAQRAMQYSAENPLYVVSIGAITNIASAILLNPEITGRMVVVWLGGHALSWPDTKEFNMVQDIAAARIIFGCGVPWCSCPAWAWSRNSPPRGRSWNITLRVGTSCATISWSMSWMRLPCWMRAGSGQGSSGMSLPWPGSWTGTSCRNT